MWMKKMKALVDRLHEIYMFVSAVGFVLVIFIVFLGVVMRYVFHNPLTWAEELSIFLFTWIAFISGGMLQKDDEHMAIGFVVEALPKPLQTFIDYLVKALIIIMSGVLIYSVCQVFPMKKGLYTAALQIPRNMYNVPIILFAVSVILFSVYQMAAGTKNEN